MAENSNESGNEEKEQPEIHVDQDWKKSVQQERQRIKQQEEQQKNQGPKQRGQEVPEASFQVFLAGLYTQTLMAMGLAENPLTGKKEKKLPEAQYLIDTIDMLKQKTEGNLTEQEGAYISNLLYDLRMRFIDVSKDGPENESEGAEQGG